MEATPARSAKDIRVAPVSREDAVRLIKAVHYSGTVTSNGQLHFGVFLDGKLEGAMQFGPSLDKRKVIGLVRGTAWNEFIELNRMAFGAALPRNSESRALAVAFRLIRKHYAHLKWVISFADATQCGDGAIYRAAGFLLTQIKKNSSLWIAPDGEKFTDVGIRTGGDKLKCAISKTTVAKGPHAKYGGGASMKRFEEAGFRTLAGFQLRYIYFLDASWRDRLTVPTIPFSEIEKRGAGMYLGKAKLRAGSFDNEAAGCQSAEGGARPTAALQNPII